MTSSKHCIPSRSPSRIASRRLAFILALFHVFARAHGGLQDLNRGNAAVLIFSRQQPLRNDVAETLDKAMADDVLLGNRKCSDDALHGLRGIGGVQSGHDEVPGFRGFQRNLNGLAIAHFANQDHFGRLAQSGPQRQAEARGIAVQLALVNGALLVRMDEFDRIFDGDDVPRFLDVDLVDDRSERGALAGAGWPGDQHNSIDQAGDVAQLRRKVQASRRWAPYAGSRA